MSISITPFNPLSKQTAAASPSAKPINTENSQELLQRKRTEAEQVAQDFETMFVDLMVKSMRQTAQPEDVSNAEDVYQGMLDSEYAKSMTTTNSFGIREKILEWLEQTDPRLKQPSENNTVSRSDQKKRAEMTQPPAQLVNEALALKAATQAYQLSSHPR